MQGLVCSAVVALTLLSVLMSVIDVVNGIQINPLVNPSHRWKTHSTKDKGNSFLVEKAVNAWNPVAKLLRTIQQNRKIAEEEAKRESEIVQIVQHLRSQPVIALSEARQRRLMKKMSVFKGGASDRKRVLVLMSDTGGGHRASAQALDQALQDQFPDQIDVNVMDIWTEHGGWPYNHFVPMYRWLAKHPIMWRAMYLYGRFPPTKLLQEFMSARSCYRNFEQAIVQADPDFVVSVHPLCQLMPISIVKGMNRKRDQSKPRIPFVTVVTDLGGAHSTWFDKRVDACFVPSEAVYNIALHNGMPETKILMKGLPIRPSFWKPNLKEKEETRRDLGLPATSVDVKTVMLMGGGDGVGGLGKIACEVANKLKRLDVKSQIIVICGHNKKMSEQLMTQLQPSEHLKVVVKGFVNNIDEFMAASDCLITKAGPGTIAESMIRGLPLVLSSFLPGQEYGNVPYVVKGGFGVYTGNRPKKIANTVGALFTDDVKLHEMSEKAKQQSHPEATMTIAKDIGELLLRPYQQVDPLKTPEY